MRRPLCCVCVAFVATVFLYLSVSPPSEPVRDLPEGERVTLIGEVCQKEYQSVYQRNTLVIWLKDIRRWSPDSGQAAEKLGNGRVGRCFWNTSEVIWVMKQMSA